MHSWTSWKQGTLRRITSRGWGWKIWWPPCRRPVSHSSFRWCHEGASARLHFLLLSKWSVAYWACAAFVYFRKTITHFLRSILFTALPPHDLNQFSPPIPLYPSLLPAYIPQQNVIFKLVDCRLVCSERHRAAGIDLITCEPKEG